MSFGQRLAALFNVHSDEERPVVLFILYFLVLGIAINFTLSASFALFVAEFGAQKLPFAYMAIAVVVSLMAIGYLRLAQRVAFRRLVAFNLGFLMVVSIAIWLGLTLSHLQWLIFLLPVWFQGMVTLAYLAFWSMAGSFFDVRQSKRLFGLIASGLWLAAVAAGFLIPPLVTLLGTSTLYLLSAIALLIALYLQRAIFRLRVEPQAPGEGSRRASAAKPRRVNILRNRYILLIFGMIVLWWLGFYFVDNIFYDRAAVQFPEAAQLASVIGTLVAVEGIVALFISFFVSSRLTARFGLRAGLLAVPVTLMVCMGGLAILGSIDQKLAALFWLAALAKMFNVALGFSLDQSTRTILYQPLPDAERVRTMTLADGIVQSLAIGLAGVFLLVFNTLLQFHAVELTYILLVILVGWIGSVIVLMREYPNTLAGALRKRLLEEGSPLDLADSSSLAVLRNSLQSPYPEAVIYSMNVLREVGYDPFSKLLPTLLEHPMPEARREALRHIEELGLRSSYQAVEQRVQIETDPTVREVALRALAAVSDGNSFELVTAALDSPEMPLRRGAIIGLIRYGGLEGVLGAGQHLVTMTTSQDASERALAAEILGEIGIRNFYQPLIPLLNDADVRVRRAALTSASTIKHPQLWTEVMRALEVPNVRQAAVQALIRGGADALPSVRMAFGSDVHTPREILILLLRVCARTGGDQVISLLQDKINHIDPILRTHILAALESAGYRASGEAAAAVQQQLKSEAGDAAWILTARRDLEGDEAVSLLNSALDYNFSQIRERIFYLLAFLYDPQPISRARHALLYGDSSQRAFGLEVLESRLSPELKGWLFPLLDDLTVAQRLQKLVPLFPQTSLNRQKRLEMLANEAKLAWFPWMRACVLYSVGSLGVVQAASGVRTGLNAPEAVVREAASRALAQLEHSEQTSMKTESNGQMLSTIEKVIILKTVSIFSGIPDEVLAEVAGIVEEIEIREGERIFEKGDLGDSMYIVISGKVRVHDGERLLNMLGERDVFGEMALLDPEPRVASVTTVEDTHLFRLGQEPFFELIDDYGEVARGIIRVLAGHLRARVRDLAEVRSKLEALQHTASSTK